MKYINRTEKFLLYIVAIIIILDIAILVKPPHILYKDFADHLFSLLCVIATIIMFYLTSKGVCKHEE